MESLLVQENKLVNNFIINFALCTNVPLIFLYQIFSLFGVVLQLHALVVLLKDMWSVEMILPCNVTYFSCCVDQDLNLANSLNNLKMEFWKEHVQGAIKLMYLMILPKTRPCVTV